MSITYINYIQYATVIHEFPRHVLLKNIKKWLKVVHFNSCMDSIFACSWPVRKIFTSNVWIIFLVPNVKLIPKFNKLVARIITIQRTGI